jgi:hypothetical protein
VRWGDGRCVVKGLVDVPATWVLDLAIPVLAAVALVLIVRDAVRRRRVTWWLMLSVSSALCWWLEAFGDWGQHLNYSPEFHHYTLTWRWTAPHNPYWMPLMYAVYWVAHAWAILRLAQWLQRRRPRLSLGRAIVVLSVPVTWVWNLCIEGFATSVGWWSYEPPIGPYLDTGRGKWPLLWPMLLLFGWINLIAWMVGPPEEESSFNRIERLFRLDRLRTRRWAGAGRDGEPFDPTRGTVRFQLVRFLAWTVFFQVTFVLLLDLPLVGLRLLSRWGTPYS